MRVYVVAAVLFVAGFANVARGLDHAGDAYRPWALHHGSYSDIIAMGGDRYLDGEHPVPYLEDRIEYPVIIGFLLWLPSFVPGGATGHLAATAALLGACLMLTIRLLRRIPGANPWLFAATPALALYGTLNWDLVGIMFLVAAVATGSGGLLGLGVATKLFPLAAVPAFVRHLRARWLAIAAGVVVIVNAPVAAAAFDNWRYFFTFNSDRPPDFAIWNALSVTSPAVVNVASLVCVGAAALVALAYGRTPAASRYALALVIAVWLATNKISSPQFSLWLFAAAAMVAAPWRIFGALVVVSTFDFLCELWLYPRHALALHPVVAVMVIARTAATLWFAAWCFRRLRVEVARDEGAQVGGDLGGDRTGAPDGLHLAR